MYTIEGMHLVDIIGNGAISISSHINVSTLYRLRDTSPTTLTVYMTAYRLEQSLYFDMSSSDCVYTFRVTCTLRRREYFPNVGVKGFKQLK